MIYLISLLILLCIIYVNGILAIKKALDEIRLYENSTLANRIDKLYNECKKEMDDGK